MAGGVFKRFAWREGDIVSGHAGGGGRTYHVSPLKSILFLKWLLWQQNSKKSFQFQDGMLVGNSTRVHPGTPW
ncbi:MAG: hypothetical protein BV459_01505 [Thermoplasmata archaeon M11B2D]|nr:MAG: hypothetical protein BV459_01505 [Thermoplasmata archaeon M11B2D]